MTPQSIGRQSNVLVLGRHSGKSGLKQRIKELGYSLKEEDFKKIFVKFLELADKKKEVFNESGNFIKEILSL